MLALRPFQKAALAALDQSAHVLCVAPTGSGKSLIYERAARKSGRRTLLVTPLVALARQQHARLNPGIQATLGAGQPSLGPPTGSGIWIVSPEKLLNGRAISQLRQWRPDFLVVDECHCIWEWGESFRPAVLAIPRLLREYSIPSSLWHTATLPTEAREALREAIAPARLTELGGFELPPRLELNIARVPWPERAEALVGWIRQQSAPGIVFVPTRDSAHRLTRLAHAAGRVTLAYHAGMSSEERRAIEARIAADLPDVIVATSAFGMGMDYPRLQWAVLWQAPPSLLSLAQAIGRAGRDPSRPARALVLWEPDDLRLLEWTLRGSERRKLQLERVMEFLSGQSCRRNALKIYFGGGLDGNDEGDCGACDFCCAAGRR